MKLPLTPGQAVTVHGWVRPRLWLTWVDVLADPRLTFRFLADTCRLGEASLHQLQPDLAAWTRASRVQLEDAPRLRPWEAHPVRDLGADLADLIRMGWGADALARLGVTYEDLLGIGLSGENMGLFSSITLAGWASLGFRRAHAERVAPHTLARLFMMTRADVLASLP